ncbi:MAG TPA: NAD-glutamate dehydrogenase [Solirubrobacteraceae bacterium]|nr:NAD-glutamate dehydrogenase [Solirubrobacteraceae bacterium]
MAVRTTEAEAELIAGVCERVRERVPSDQAGSCEAFVRQYYHWVPPVDLAGRSSLDLYGAAVSHWNLTAQRHRGEVKLHVYNPEFERHGWQSPHTVIEVVTDDMPFLVDSVTMELSRSGYGTHLVIHPVIRVVRDGADHLIGVTDPTGGPPEAEAESILHVEIDRENDPERLAELAERIERVLGDVSRAVEDWQPMRERALALVEELADGHAPVSEPTLAEIRSFLRWLTEDRFTFLGYREYDLIREPSSYGQRGRLQAVPDSGLGILRGAPASPVTSLSERAFGLAVDDSPLLLTKANSRATVHRPSYLDYVGVKRFDAEGRVIGERRFLGLFTTAAYKESPLAIPLLRGKVNYVLERAAFPPDSHDAKALREICESYPRDSLFQIDSEELFRIAMGILGLGERQRVRVFAHSDVLERFVTCLVCLPRDRFNTENRLRAGDILLDALDGSHFDWSLQLTESTIAKVHYIVHTRDGVPPYDEQEIESRIVTAIRAWSDDLRDALVEEHGEQAGLRQWRRFEHAFPPAYRADWMARSAVGDVARIEELEKRRDPILRIYRPLEAEPDTMRCKLFSLTRISLSDVLPTFEHMGARVIDERPYEITPADGPSLWIYDFGMRSKIEEVEKIHDLFEEAFLGVWRGELEDDALGALVLRAGLTGREITVLRAIARYLRQAGVPFTDSYIQRTVIGHPDIAVLLLRLFGARFDPDWQDQAKAERLSGEIVAAIDAVPSLDEDRILRSFHAVVCATLRTNYYKRNESAPGRPPAYLSFKLDPEQIPLLPAPRPRFEIFVYSPRIEGVHLRGGRVARGGIRWSDRPEDFRTEVLGLMKAQMVKNALIVPVGSKGGFVLKRPPAGRDELQDEAIACYRMFLCGLLDLTDNYVGDEVVGPDRVVRHDEDDPYLVVAADKGTATFSDIANEVAAQYGYWLGDAFASGGSRGYDHKAMGITARGAWESVKRHFRELGIDISSADFTVVGIGDMSGDVFGNGMLLSEHIRLVAAFNHQHIFLDPDPDPAASFAERRRLFELRRSTWSDYDQNLISEGGGIHPRTAKSIQITPQVAQALDIEAAELAPAELVSAILCAPVDLLWNGGIGTYVKACEETHAEAGDKANDAVRVDAEDLRCRVVGEGGNLGFTQAGRIEYALEGGRINTDAVDNVAGVNCSDHEVNIKILLDALVKAGDMTEKQRNELLEEMTDAVAEQVLQASCSQTQAISLSMFQAAAMVDVHGRLIRQLERRTGLNRELEHLPSPSAISARKKDGRGLTAPELSVIMAFCKILVHSELLDSDLPEDPYLSHDLERYFPAPLPERYREQMQSHRLRREIIATVVANQLVDLAGTTFFFRVGEETGASASTLARGFAVAREVYGMREMWEWVEELDNEVEAGTQLSMLVDVRRLVERAARWLVRANPTQMDIEALVRRYEPGARMLWDALPQILDEEDRDRFETRAAQLTGAGVPERLARRVAGLDWALPAFDIIEVAESTGSDADVVMRTSFGMTSRLRLGWLRERILELPRDSRWEALARAALRDDLNSLVRVVTQEVLQAGGPAASAEQAMQAWEEEHHGEVERCLGILGDIESSGTYDTTTLPVALRELRNLVRTSSGSSTGLAPAG